MHRRVLTAAVAVATSAAVLAPAPAQANLVSATPVRTIGGPGHAGLYGWGATTMLDGSVLIGDYWNKRVVHYAQDGTLLGDFVKSPGFGPTQHQAPYGLATDPNDGSIFMADTDRYKVIKYSPTGQFLFSVGTNGTSGAGPGLFRYPSRVAVRSDSWFYVADTWDNNIVVFDETGTERFQFGSFGTADGQFKQPHGIAFDAQDRLWVADTGNKRVVVFDADGNFLFKFGSQGGLPGQFAGDLRGLAIDKVNGWVYVVDGEGDRVSKFDMTGGFILRFGSSGFGPGQFSDGGREATVDGDGNLWVGDMPNFRAQKFSPTGDFLLEVPNPAQPPPLGGFNGPRGVTVDGLGNIFVTDTYNQRLQRLDAVTGTWTAWGTRGRDEFKLNYARMVAIDPLDGSVVVADTDNHRIKKYDNTGTTLIWQVGGLGSGNQAKFRNPHGVDVSADGSIVVADSRNKRGVVLNSDGTFRLAFGSQGTGDGQFSFPRGAAWGPDGTIWIADMADRVQHFSATGEFLGRFGNSTVFGAPFDVEVDAQHVYVVDTPVNMVKVFEYDGTQVGSFGGGGKKLGKMQGPNGAELVGDRLFVMEQVNERIQEWQLSFATP